MALGAISCLLACAKSEIDIILLSFRLFFFLSYFTVFCFKYLALLHLARCHEGLQLAGLFDGSGEVLVAGLCDEDVVLDTASG